MEDEIGTLLIVLLRPSFLIMLSSQMRILKMRLAWEMLLEDEIVRTLTFRSRRDVSGDRVELEDLLRSTRLLGEVGLVRDLLAELTGGSNSNERDMTESSEMDSDWANQAWMRVAIEESSFVMGAK